MREQGTHISFLSKHQKRKGKEKQKNSQLGRHEMFIFDLIGVYLFIRYSCTKISVTDDAGLLSSLFFIRSLKQFRNIGAKIHKTGNAQEDRLTSLWRFHHVISTYHYLFYHTSVGASEYSLTRSTDTILVSSSLLIRTIQFRVLVILNNKPTNLVQVNP